MAPGIKLVIKLVNVHCVSSFTKNLIEVNIFTHSPRFHAIYLSTLNKTLLLPGFPCGTVVKNLPANAGDARDVGLIPGVGNGNSLQYSCLNNSVDRGAWWPTVQGSQRAGHD